MDPRPFRNAPDRQILAFCVVGYPHRATMILQAKTLLKYVPSASAYIPAAVPTYAPTSAKSSKPPPVRIPWENWGASGTRWIPECCDRDWLCGCHGSRFVTLIPAAADGHHRTLQHRIKIMDFNPYEVSRYQECSTPWTSSKRVADKTVIPAGGLWKNDIVSTLPFTEVTLEVPCSISGAMMDESHVIGVKTNGDGELIALEILTL